MRKNKHKNIKRYTYKLHAFQGWRLALRREGEVVILYFSDKFYGSETAALQAALSAKHEILTKIVDCEERKKIASVFAEAKNTYGIRQLVKARAAAQKSIQ